MPQSERARRGIERGIVEIQFFGISRSEACSRNFRPGRLHHRNREVDAGHTGALVDGRGDKVSGSAADIKKIQAGYRPDTLENREKFLLGNRGKMRVIMLCLFGLAPLLKFLEAGHWCFPHGCGPLYQIGYMDPSIRP